MTTFNIHASPAVTGTPDNTTYLRGDGTWNIPIDTNTTYTANETNITLSGTEFRLKNKTSYLSVSGAGFEPTDTTASAYERITGNNDYNIGATTTHTAEVQLPNGVIVTGAIVYGVDTAETWTLYRKSLTAGTLSSMATAAWGTEDTTISNATIDNSTYSYFIITSELNSGDRIYGARITYTTDYI